tara:strand:+ start:68 stop:316 length:249 start_codon:yes stop_codon:yes gene_type:complete
MPDAKKPYRYADGAVSLRDMKPYAKAKQLGMQRFRAEDDDRIASIEPSVKGNYMRKAAKARRIEEHESELQRLHAAAYKAVA